MTAGAANLYRHSVQVSAGGQVCLTVLGKLLPKKIVRRPSQRMCRGEQERRAAEGPREWRHSRSDWYGSAKRTAVKSIRAMRDAPLECNHLVAYSLRQWTRCSRRSVTRAAE